MQQKWIIAAAVVILLGVGAYALYIHQPQSAPATTSVDRPLKTYYDQSYGIAFNFPDNYEVEEQDATGTGTKHHTIVIGDKAALENAPANSEGPPVITIDIFANPGNAGAEKWIKGTSNSNYKLSPDGTLAPTTVAGEEALAYGWDGLYRSTSIVFPHKGQIYMLSVGYNDPNDSLRQDFAKVVASIQFDP